MVVMVMVVGMGMVVVVVVCVCVCVWVGGWGHCMSRAIKNLYVRTICKQRNHPQASADSTLGCTLDRSLALTSTVLGGRVRSSLLVNCRIREADIEECVCACVSD